MSKRRNPDAALKVRVAFEALKGERRVSDLATSCDVPPTMIHRWSEPLCAIGSRTMASALLDGAAGIFERGGKAATTAGIAEDTVRDLHAKI
jgi:transposase